MVATVAAAVAAAAPESITLSIGGMMCNGCRGKVERTLAAVDGVASASVDLDTETAVVSGTATAAELIAAVPKPKSPTGSYSAEQQDRKSVV